MPMRSPLTEGAIQDYLQQIEPLKQAFDFIPDHVAITDENGNILYANKAVERNTGFSVQEAIGKNPGDMWGGKMPKEFYEKMWQTIKVEKKPFVGEVKNVRKDGTEYWQEVHISPILDEAGNVRFFIGIEPNITDKKIQEQFRDEFVSTVGHQLKDPLASIRWALGWLRDKKGLSEQEHFALEEAYRQNQRLIDLVRDLVFLAQLEGVESRAESFDLGFEIQTIVDVLQKRFSRTHFSFEKDGKDFLVKANKPFALQVFTNIITNAAEFSDKKSGQVTVSLKHDAGGTVFSCMDNGIGIPEEEQPNIFSKFFRASNARAMKEVGTGIGLFITKMVVDALHWSIFFKSTPGVGTTFYITIPKK